MQSIIRFAQDVAALEDVISVTPHYGLSPVNWKKPPTHLVVLGKATGVPRMARAHGLYPVQRLTGGWDILPADAGGHVRHVLMMAYDETTNWRDDELGMNLAYLAMAMLQGTRALHYSADGAGHPFVALLRSMFHETHPLWSYIEIK